MGKLLCSNAGKRYLKAAPFWLYNRKQSTKPAERKAWRERRALELARLEALRAKRQAKWARRKAVESGLPLVEDDS